MIRRVSLEVAVNQVQGGCGLPIAPCRHWPALAVTGSGEPGRSHELGNALAAMPLPLKCQLGMDARHPVDAQGRIMEGSHTLK